MQKRMAQRTILKFLHLSLGFRLFCGFGSGSLCRSISSFFSLGFILAAKSEHLVAGGVKAVPSLLGMFTGNGTPFLGWIVGL